MTLSFALALNQLALSPQDTMKYIKAVENSGFSMIFFPDDLGYLDPLVLLSMGAMITDRIELGTFVNPYSRHPIYCASQIATLHEMTKGRIAIGVLPGGSYTLRPLGIKMWEKPLKAVRDTIEIMRALWRGDQVTRSNHVFSLINTKLVRSLESPLPKILMAPKGPNMLKLAAELADGILLGGISTTMLKDAVLSLKQLLKQHHRSLNDVTIYYSPHFAVDLQEEKALQSIRKDAVIAIWDTSDAALSSQQLPTSLEKVIKDIKKKQTIDDAIPYITKEAIDFFTIAGDPQTCANRINQEVPPEVDSIMFLAFAEKNMHSLHLLRDHVIPLIQ